MPHNHLRIAALASLCVVVSSGPAYAYIDPGMGSMILQGVVGAVAGGLFLLRNWWGRIVAYLPGSRKPTEQVADAFPEEVSR